MTRAHTPVSNHAPGTAQHAVPHVWLPYAQMQTTPAPLTVVGTAGTRIRLSDGRELVDGIASWWTAAHGYNHPHIVAALVDQVQTLPHVMLGGLVHAPVLELSARVLDFANTPDPRAPTAASDSGSEFGPAAQTPAFSRVFYAESGSVAVEVAMKMALQVWLNRGEPGRSRFVGFLGGYHGDTFFTMSVCDPHDGMHAKFGAVLPPQFMQPVPDTPDKQAAFLAWLHAEKHHIAGLVIEPLVQGAGGMRFFAPDVLRFLRRACDETGVLFIADEIASGFYRTGHRFAHHAAGIRPDIMTVSKALTGGTVPLSATLAGAHVVDAFDSHAPGDALMHGPTFTGNAMGCRAALASLDLFEQGDYAGRVASIAAQLEAELAPCRALDGVTDVRVLGATGVVELDPARLGSAAARDALRLAFIDAGVWIRPLENVVYLMPALTITPDELRVLTTAVRTVLHG